MNSIDVFIIVTICILHQLCVRMVISGSRVGRILLRVESRYATSTSGALCVMTSGILLTLMWPADSLDSLQWVCIHYMDVEYFFKCCMSRCKQHLPSQINLGIGQWTAHDSERSNQISSICPNIVINACLQVWPYLQNWYNAPKGINCVQNE